MIKFDAAISGWGNYPTTVSHLIRPERLSQLTFAKTPLIARGLGRSYGDAALNTEKYVLLMERLNRFLSFDAEKGILRAEAGVSLAEVLDVVVPKGWFLPVTPGTKYVTLGGCVATDAHGKNHHREGTFGQHVKEIELVLPDGSRVRCSPGENSELFWATVGGMGLTGVITEVVLQLIAIESAYMAVRHYPAQDLDQVLELLNEKEKDDRYSVAWIDCLAEGKSLGRSIVMNGHHASRSELSQEVVDPFKFRSPRKFSVPCSFPGWVLNPWSVKLFNALYFQVQSKKQDLFITDYDRYFYPLDSVGHWNRIYGKKGFLQYQFVLPSETSLEGLRVLLDKIVKSQNASFLAVLKRFGPEGKGCLSFPREGYTLALDIPVADQKLFALLDELDEDVLKYGGRVYLAKDARLKPSAFRAMYPRLQEWQKVKASVDPEGKICSDLSRRLEMEQQFPLKNQDEPQNGVTVGSPGQGRPERAT